MAGLAAITVISLTSSRAITTVACLGAHPDDIEIGCAGTLVQLAQDLTDVYFVIASSDADRAEEAEESARALLGDHCAVRVIVGGFDDGFLPYEAREVKSFVREAVAGVAADIVLAPARSDAHQDHRFVAELASQLFRDHLILGYEIPKYDGDLVPPNFYVPLSVEAMEAKLHHLAAWFPSQHEKPWYRADVFRSLATIRGVEARSSSGFAEAFHARKAVFG